MATRLLAIALIVGLLAGCTGSSGGGSKPTPTPTPTSPATSVVTSPSPSPDRTGPLTTGPNVRPGEKPPVYPLLARERSARGALALAIYYFRAYDWGYATNDGTLVRNVSKRSCEGCTIYLNGLSKLEEKHQVLTGGRLSVPKSSVQPVRDGKYGAEYVADMTIDEDPIVIHTGSASRTVSPRYHKFHSLVYLSWSGSGWLVAEVVAQ